jgi:non-ribosomal peptide synthetase component F
LQIQQGAFDAAGIATIEQAFHAVLQAQLKTPQAMLDRFPLMTDDDSRILIENTHSVSSPTSAFGCWHDAFSAQAALTPDAPAIKYNSRIWRYAELDAFTNQLARHLLNNGVEQDATVGLMLERTDLALAAIIAIHKVGACYVPFDPQLPQQRVETILKQTKLALILITQAQHHQAQLAMPVMALDAQWNEISALDDSALPSTVSADSLAYVLYTSGSTGEPKGVKIYRQLQHYVSGIIERAELDTSLTYLSIGPITTDLGNTTLFPH